MAYIEDTWTSETLGLCGEKSDMRATVKISISN